LKAWLLSGFNPTDNVRVSLVPEPSTLALIGLAGVALVAQRKK
jgi:hypothetical protein